MEALVHHNISAALLLINFGASPKADFSIMQSDEAGFVKGNGNKELTEQILPLFRKAAFQRLFETLRSLSQKHASLRNLPVEI